jgi:hypothetical protein
MLMANDNGKTAQTLRELAIASANVRQALRGARVADLIVQPQGAGERRVPADRGRHTRGVSEVTDQAAAR